MYLKPEQSMYQVKQSGKIMASGNFRQCVLYLMNVADIEKPIIELQQQWCIEPATQQAPRANVQLLAALELLRDSILADDSQYDEKAHKVVNYIMDAIDVLASA